MDVRYIEEHSLGFPEPIYLISVLENYSRACLPRDAQRDKLKERDGLKSSTREVVSKSNREMFVDE